MALGTSRCPLSVLSSTLAICGRKGHDIQPRICLSMHDGPYTYVPAIADIKILTQKALIPDMKEQVGLWVLILSLLRHGQPPVGL